MIAGLASKISSHWRTSLIPLSSSARERYPFPFMSIPYHILFLACLSPGSFFLHRNLLVILFQSMSETFYLFLDPDLFGEFGWYYFTYILTVEAFGWYICYLALAAFNHSYTNAAKVTDTGDLYDILRM